MLEERLADFAGTVLVVSHDRSFLDNVVTSTLAFEPADGDAGQRVREYVGGYSDWLRQRAAAAEPGAPAARAQAERSPPPAAASTATKRKRSFKEQREFDSLPAVIEGLETEIAALHATMAEPGYYKQAGDLLARDQAQLCDLESRLAEAFARWEALDAGA